MILSVPSVAFAQTDLVFQESCASDICHDLPHVDGKYFGVQKPLSPGDEITFDIVIQNPSQLQLYSVSSWLKYDASIFKAKNLSDEDSAFPLAAPGEFEVDSVVGEVKIGRAVLGTPITTPMIHVAKITFEVLKNPKGKVISFLDYQSSDVGKTAVLTIENLITTNVLSAEPKSLKFLQGEGGGGQHAAAPVVTPTPTPAVDDGSQSINTSVPPVPSYIPNIPEYVDIPRPEGFRARTHSSGNLEFLWKFGEDPRIAGYYLYYDTLSGSYIHRRDMGRTNNYAIPDGVFEKGKRYYFALRAYDVHGKMSDFSDEAYVVVGISGSESHPFYGTLFVGSQDLSLPARGLSEYQVSANIVSPTPLPNINTPTHSATGPFLGVYIIMGVSGFILLCAAVWKSLLIPLFFARRSP